MMFSLKVASQYFKYFSGHKNVSDLHCLWRQINDTQKSFKNFNLIIFYNILILLLFAMRRQNPNGAKLGYFEITLAVLVYTFYFCFL